MLTGSDRDIATAATFDAAGNAYVAGYASDCTGASSAIGDVRTQGYHISIKKINAARDKVLYWTCIGRGQALAIAVDDAGNAYVAGSTDSGLPTTPNAFQSTADGGFVLKLNAAGTGLVFSTMLTGTSGSAPRAIAVDRGGNVFVTGSTYSADFPTTPGAVQPRLAAPGEDAFLSKLDRTGSRLLYSTYLGGSGPDSGRALALDGAENAYLAILASSDFPHTPGAVHQEASAPATRTAIAKVSAGGTHLLWSAKFALQPGNLAVGTDGSVVVVGAAQCSARPDLYETDAAVVRLNASGSDLSYSACIGGGGYDQANSVALDSSGAAYIAGSTTSADFPLVGSLQPCGMRVNPQACEVNCSDSTSLRGMSDVFVARLDASGRVSRATLVGGSASEWPLAASVFSGELAGVVGNTYSTDFPWTQPGSGSGLAFASTLPLGGASDVALSCVVDAASLSPAPVAPGELVTLFGEDIGPEGPVYGIPGENGRLPITLANGTPAPMLFMNRRQINTIVLLGIKDQETVQLRIRYSGRETNAITVPVRKVSPGVFTRNATGFGDGAILNQDLSVNNRSNPAARGSFLAIYVTGAGLTDPVPIDGQLSGLPPAQSIYETSVDFVYPTGWRPYFAIDSAAAAYSGAAPTLVAGVSQVNVQVPDTVPKGPVQLSVCYGQRPTTVWGKICSPRVTVYIR